MRLWSLHPKYLDRIGLIALWREGLLAKKVLLEKTKGYKNHPQLDRFKFLKNKDQLINNYLYFVFLEAQKRGYKFDKNKITFFKTKNKILINKGQVAYEFSHLQKKLKIREPKKYQENEKIKEIEINGIFGIREGGVEKWERTKL
jgi:hypothetical protein